MLWELPVAFLNTKKSPKELFFRWRISKICKHFASTRLTKWLFI